MGITYRHVRPTKILQVGSSVEPLFSDDFEAYTVGANVEGEGGSGFAYTDRNLGPGSSILVSDAESFSGSKSLRFRFAANADNADGNAEQRFSYPDIQRESWVEFRFHVPSNYKHRNQADGEHHKFYSLWSVGYGGSGRPKVVLEFWRTDDDTSYMRFIHNFAGQGGSVDVANNTKQAISASGPLFKGQWHRIRIWQDTGTEGDDNAAFKVWIDDALFFDFSGIANTGNNNFYWDAGYLMGYSNGGYDEQTDFHVDDFKIYDTDPGWS